MDPLTPDQRSKQMARVRAKDTGPEMVVRQRAHRLGYRFRLHRRDLPGNPDLVFVSRRKVVFVHGCFWHGHSCRRGQRMPKANRKYWREKIARNVRRDRRHRRRLNRLGWGVMVIWECQLRDPERIDRRLKRFLGPAKT